VAADLETLIAPARAAGAVVRVCLKAGDPAQEILEQIRRTAPDIVVMGTHARSGLNRRALGSVSDDILRASPSPVLTVACRTEDADGPPAAAGDVVCAVGLDDGAVEAIEWASLLARASGARLTLLHVAGHGPVEDARRRLRTLAARAGIDEGSAEELVVRGDPARQTLRLAATRGAGLVVVALRRRDDAPRIDAATNRLIRSASCAVLTIPTGAS
jgi:nucleotide-binding universal stress UspA family protein